MLCMQDHTFEGYSCNGDGDGVSDTAPQKSPTNTCSSTISDTDTCPDQDNLPDPVHNYMNYVDDPCAHSFTPGQALKSHITWQLVRADANKVYTPSPNMVPTTSPADQITAFPTRGLRPDGDRNRPDRDRIRDDVERTRPPLEIIVEDTINCPAVWPGDGTVCVMIDGFNRKKCIYYEYSADSICTCTSKDLFWTCVHGPDYQDDDFAAGLDLSNSEDSNDGNFTLNIEDIADFSISTTTDAISDEETTSVLSLTGQTEQTDETLNEIPVLSLLSDGRTFDRVP